MKNGKYAKRGITTKAFALILAVVSLVSIAVGGTIAWLTDVTDEVTNTFTPSDIAITLTETEGVVDSKWQKQMIPGMKYDKDPTVAVTDDETNIDVYLFVKFEEGSMNSTYLDYTSTLNEDNGWNLVDGENNVWWRIVENNAPVQSWKLLAELDENSHKEVMVNSDVTADQASNPTNIGNVYLKYTAYAIQKEGFANAAAAWAEAKNL